MLQDELNAYLDQVLPECLPPGITFRRQLMAPAAEVDGDEEQLRRAVWCLLENAFQAVAPGHGVVELTLRRVPCPAHLGHGRRFRLKNECLELQVRDNGEGMTAEVMERCRQPFFSTRRSQGAQGLGLAVASGIVEGHGGSLLLESAPGVGTTLVALLPLHVREEPVEPVLSGEVGTGPARRILLVDDEPLLLDILKRSLEALGHEVSAYSDPLRALESFRSAPESYGLLVTDVVMEGLLGTTLAERCRRLAPDLLVVLTTGQPSAFLDELLERGEADALLRKPLTRGQLAEVVERLLPRGHVEA